MSLFLRCSLLLLLLSACGTSKQDVQLAAPAPLMEPTSVSYQNDIKPIFEQKCIACHACFDAPCQLNLSHADGLTRGVNKTPVYKGSRTDKVTPTRLGFDAQTTAQWRELGFKPVIPNQSAVPNTSTNSGANRNQQLANLQASLMYKALDAGMRHQWQPGAKLPDDIELGLGRKNSCPSNEEHEEYIAERPQQGMPLAVSGLSNDEFRKLQSWIATGAAVEPVNIELSQEEKQLINQWESYLNRQGKREKLVARYLYEHWFAAHLYFPELMESGKPTRFYEILRSRTSSGKPVDPVATVRPNDDPQGMFYYRLRVIDSSIVAKTHITYPLSQTRKARLNELFFNTNWSLKTLPGYGKEESANPFITFAAIPAKSRYQFLLDDAHYFVRNFIRGPVCRGQIAVNVIRDQFWAYFEDPEQEQYVNNATYREQVSPLLGMPGQETDLISLATEWDEYQDKNNNYLAKRKAQYAAQMPNGPDMQSIWDGDGHDRDALLTIMRHHDNAFVEQGLHGAIPQTMWVMDYPLFERTYYHLVTNFNVFGNVSHQAQTRLYFDVIRHGGETNFLRYMPAEHREALMKDWYAGSGKLKLAFSYEEIDSETPTGIDFVSDEPKAEFSNRIMQRMANIMSPADVINRCDNGDCAMNQLSAKQRLAAQALRRIANVPAKDMPAAKLLPEVTFLRVREGGKQRQVYSLVHNRAHSNVAFMLAEKARWEPEQDTLQILPGLFGVYPNFIFDVALAELDSFTQQLRAVQNENELTAVVERYGLRRTDPNFWTVFHDFYHWQQEHNPIDAGILDMNRYVNL